MTGSGEVHAWITKPEADQRIRDSAEEHCYLVRQVREMSDLVQMIPGAIRLIGDD